MVGRTPLSSWGKDPLRLDFWGDCAKFLSGESGGLADARIRKSTASVVLLVSDVYISAAFLGVFVREIL